MGFKHTENLVKGRKMATAALQAISEIEDANKKRDLVIRINNATSAIEGFDDEFGLSELREILNEFAPKTETPAPAPAPAPTKTVEEYARMGAKELATEYMDDVARIVGSAGEMVTAGMFADAGLEWNIDAAASRAAAIMRERAIQWSGDNAEAIAEALVEGAKSSESAHTVAAALESMNIDHAETIARTELAHARETANLDIMKQRGVTKVQWVASPDDRMCEECGALHGQIFDVGNVPDRPVHPNCRCTVVEFVEFPKEF